MYVRELFSYWLVAGMGVLMVGVLFDVVSTATVQWGWTEQDTFYTYMGLFKVCNGTREVTRRDKIEIYRLDPTCYTSTDLNQKWIIWTMGMECVGLVCAVLTSVSIIAFIISLKCEYYRSRSVLMAVIPLAIITGSFNFIGIMTFVTGVGNIGNSPGWSLAVDVLATICFVVGAVLCTLDIQGCCMKRRPNIGKGLTRPI